MNQINATYIYTGVAIFMVLSVLGGLLAIKFVRNKDSLNKLSKYFGIGFCSLLLIYGIPLIIKATGKAVSRIYDGDTVGVTS